MNSHPARARTTSARRTSLALACAAGLVVAPFAALADGPSGVTAPAVASVSTGPLSGPASVADGVTHEENDRVPVGASWTEHYFPSSDGSDVELHADVLRPAHLSSDEPTPVILSVGPYFAHIGQTGNDGFSHTGPSARFNDLIDGASLMERGYTVVMVDLRGYGGSTGCLDFAGPGEQADTVAAVDWAASQPWSTGRVGLYGKSYDAVTGLLGANHEPEGLGAVVAQEPLWDMYNYLYSNGVPRPNVTGTPRAYNSIASLPGMADDTERYRANAAYEENHPECLENNLSDPQNPDPDSDYWSARNLAAMADGSAVPLFLTQGFLEPNTKPEDMQQYLANHDGEQRGWLGPFEHVRGNDRGRDGVLRMGREGWFEEVMRFYDEHLRDVEPNVMDPAFAIQDNFGQWRAQDTWPVVTSSTTARLESGSYVDDGGESPSRLAVGPHSDTGVYDMEHAPELPEVARHGANSDTGPKPRVTEDDNSYYSWSRPVNHDTRITGTPEISFQAQGVGNVLVRLWDVAPDGTAIMFDEQMSVVTNGQVSFTLKDTDWTLQEGHQLAVGVGTNTTWGWRDQPSGQTITVSSPTLTLDLQNTRNDVPTQGDRAPYLDSYLANYTGVMETGVKGTFSLNADQGRH
ncbi:CocE/NonD family hydrolase [Ornithinimicrobium murale]|uniref:CocE/NonD family hydrolase n=1 Tax=Ornithinimicrobium murale TaxID=1050153 RepID=UPI0013B3CC95|nr:CocE/NonD family hydrolase [Ornithinimicrobium murale]